MAEPASLPSHILPLIILSQFACTTIWFAGNAVMADLERDWGLPDGSLGYVNIGCANRLHTWHADFRRARHCGPVSPSKSVRCLRNGGRRG